MDQPTRFHLSAGDGTQLAGFRWDPAGQPRAIAEIAHGVGEHSLRYDHVAKVLAAQGFVVYAHDHRAHGDSATSPEAYGILGDDGWIKLVADLGTLAAHGRSEHPHLPLAIVGHSLGSFATQQYLLNHSKEVDAVVLSGTTALDLLEEAIDLDADMDLSMFNSAFEPGRTDFDWLSRDAEQVDKYIADPACGFGLDSAGTRALCAGAREFADHARASSIRSDLPLYVVVGDMDPVNSQLALVNTLVDRLRAAGLKDITLKTYPGARHEVFNEINRDEVISEMAAWLDAHLSSA